MILAGSSSYRQKPRAKIWEGSHLYQFGAACGIGVGRVKARPDLCWYINSNYQNHLSSMPVPKVVLPRASHAEAGKVIGI